MNKKFIFILVSIISVSAMLFTSCKKEETVDWIKFNKIYFEPETLFLEAGETADVSVIALYTDASEVNVTDSVTIVCSDASSVEYANGKVTAKKDGKVTLSTYYNGSNAECNIVASTIERIEISVADVIDDLLLIPGQKIEGEAVEVTAYYTAGGSKVIEPDEFISNDPKVLSIKKDDDGNITELQAVKSEGEQTWISASYKTVNGTTKTDELKVYTAELENVSITLGATKLDKGKPKYQRDTLLLGDKTDVIVTGYFSWSVFGKKDKDTVDARSFVDEFTYEHKCFYVDTTKYTVDAVGLTSDDNEITVHLFGGNHSVSSRCIDVVKDTLYKAPTYKVFTDAKYAYDDDVVYFKFTEEYVSKDGKKTKTVDLTNTGNTDITSGYYITEPKTTFCDPTFFKLCTGKIQLSEQAFVQAIEVSNEDSTGIVVIYKTSSKIDTVYSNQFRLYTHPQMGYNTAWRAKYGEVIVLNWCATHLWEDEAEVVDNFGNRYTVANGGIITKPHDSKPALNVYCVPLASDMYNRTYTFTYGPEKRQCILTVGAAPQN